MRVAFMGKLAKHARGTPYPLGIRLQGPPGLHIDSHRRSDFHLLNVTLSPSLPVGDLHRSGWLQY